MLVRFWGTRGSLPSPLSNAAVRSKIRKAVIAAIGKGLDNEDGVDAFIDGELAFPQRGTYGGNSPCVQIDIGTDAYFLCDLGTGAREFGHYAMARSRVHGPRPTNVFMSHVHWDHIMGFPFYAPAYVAGHRIRIHGCHAELERAFRRQHGAPSFPVRFDQLAADIEFVRLEPERWYDVDGLRVTALVQHHGGDSYAYRFEHRDRSVVYSTDSEHKAQALNEDYPFVRFFRGADLVIFDAMYSLADSVSVKEDWGHSSNIVGVELCHMAGAKRLCLFHHEPIHDDDAIDTVLRETIRFEEISREGAGLEVIAAYDGLEIRL